jgi:hypothetical protein
MATLIVYGAILVIALDLLLMELIDEKDKKDKGEKL